MKTILAILVLSLLVCGCRHTGQENPPLVETKWNGTTTEYVPQEYPPINRMSEAHAVKLVSSLKIGMHEEDIVQLLASNRLYTFISDGDAAEWGDYYYLTNSSYIKLYYSPEHPVGISGVNGPRSGGNGSLVSADVTESDSNIVSIALKPASK